MTVLAFAMLAAVTVAHPAPGARLSAVDRCYLIGAVDCGATNVVVDGRSFPVYRTGAWAAMADVRAGVNTVKVSCGREACVCSTSLVFRVAARRPGGNAAPPSPGKYAKLPCAGDEPKPHPRNRPPAEVTVVVDPGHGGSDTGAVSPHGRFEKDVNLMLALDIRRELEKLGYRVVMTRVTDRAVALYDRPKAIYAAGADAFVSVHHNAPAADRDAGAIRYAAVYSWNPLGEAIAKHIAEAMDRVQRAELPSNGPLHANFAVTRNPEVPSCLIEADFITNPAGEEAAWDAKKRLKLAEAVAAGIAEWHGWKGAAGVAQQMTPPQSTAPSAE